MAEMTGEEYFPNDTYYWQWSVFWTLAIAVGFLMWLSFFRPARLPPPPYLSPSAGYDWFLVLHMPEVPMDPAKAAVSARTLHGWLKELQRHGYKPMLLSEVHSRLARGLGLPERAIVLVYEPGYHHTYDTLLPVFLQHRVPAVWVTNRTWSLRGDRHYMNARERMKMVRSGYYNVGFSGDGFWVKGTAEELRHVTFSDGMRIAWAPQTGRTALNWQGHFDSLQRLDVSPKWTAEDLIDRIAMELPLHGTVRLGVKMIQDHLWGVVIPSAEAQSAFTLQVPLARTANSLYWVGTKGLRDARLEIRIPSSFGQCFLWLRADIFRGDGVGIGFSGDSVFLDQKIAGRRTRLAVIPRKSPAPSFEATVILTGETLEVSGRGFPKTTVALQPSRSSSRGLVRFAVYDRVRGAARADAVDLALTPLAPLIHR